MRVKGRGGSGDGRGLWVPQQLKAFRKIAQNLVKSNEEFLEFDSLHENIWCKLVYIIRH